MTLYHADIVDIDLECGTVHRSFTNRSIGEGDILANRFGVRLHRGGKLINAGGATCMGYFIRHGLGDTVVINGGAFSGSEVWVQLPASCYAIDGAFTLVIKLVGGSITGTMRIVDGTIVDSMIGSPVDPGAVIPDISDLLAVIGRAETAAATVGEFAVYAEQIDGDEYRIVVSDGT